ncbi:oxidoreductase [Bacteriovorax stolpii]|uniref:Oxidoreductase n=1 Tax=Bacteriovorax stolpii TaxID=960 RepID=A0A2K9NTR6_BACTC|nr:aldo/keto reductase [Bacteriovorax stolpii]AUN98888.1 oxidoreductase [Bacteriovorax stolpii]TDP55591.1 diketogulonate reductase-like aldo/keto reductase [Bacteriovorax stolpii]
MRVEISQKFITLNDGMKIPTIGFGTWRVSDADAPKILDEAFGAGYRLIDTASMYGNEVGIGKAIKESSLSREEIFLTTKVWNSEHGYDATLRAMDKSLSNLKMSYVDLYLIHWPGVNSEKYIPTWKALIRLRKEGIARSIGVSNFTIDHVERLINETGVVPAINQLELHPYFQQKELRAFHDKHKIVTEAWSPLARGNLFDDEVIVALTKKHNKTPAQIVLRWHYENGIIAIPKSGNPTRMLENLDIFDFHFDKEDLAQMDTLDNVNGRTGANPLTADF